MPKTIPVVIALIERQRAAVERLAAYCRALDGTEVVVNEIPAHLEATWRKDVEGHQNWFVGLQSRAFHYVARHHWASPFIWIEADSTPLRAGWADELRDEYRASGRLFLMTGDSHPPFDIAGGIGVYPHSATSILPVDYLAHSWDLHIVRHYWDQTHFSDLVQHSYGIYDEDGHATPRRFRTAEERAFIRPEACIIHRDLYQDLIP